MGRLLWWALAGLGSVAVTKPEATVQIAATAGRAVASGVNAIYTAVAGDPLGIRLNNPGNIEINKNNKWAGEITPSSHRRYAQFSHPLYGIRALAETLETYRLSHGKVSVRDVITRWAPPHENDTAAYIRHVCQKSGLTENQDIRANPAGVVAAIIHHENGKQPYTLQLIQSAIDMSWDGV